MKVLIIEDEIKAAKELERILLTLDYNIQIVGIIDSVKNAIIYLSKHIHPDLIFSDIQLADGMCFDIYNKVTPKCPIIFCTAFDEYMVNAFETSAVSYILKPITKSKIGAALEKYEQMKSVFAPAQTSKDIDALSHKLKYLYKTALLVNQREKIIPIPVKDIAFFYLDNTMVKILTFNHQRYSISSSLDDLERNVDPQIFYRANRQFLINRDAVLSIERYFSRKLAIKLKEETPETIVVSKAKASDFLNWLESV